MYTLEFAGKKTIKSLSGSDKKFIKRLENNKVDLKRLCDCSLKTYYGKPFAGSPLFCSYGKIGYEFEYNKIRYQVDYELEKITILN